MIILNIICKVMLINHSSFRANVWVKSVLGTSTGPKYSSTSTSTLILKVLEYSKKVQVKNVLG